MDEQQVLKKLDRIKEIPTLPTIVFELNKYLQDPDTSIKTVCDTIEKDQAITLKILKLVNSAFYGFKSKISDLRNAIVLLGYNAVRNAIVSLSIISSFSKRVTLIDFDISQFWKHSLAVAVTSKNIAQLSKKESPDNCFVGGLLHDIGKVILAQYFHDLFEKVWTTLQDEHISFYEAEQKNCLSTIPESVLIWRPNGSSPAAWLKRFVGTMSFSRKARMPILYKTFTWPISLSTVRTLIRSCGWICPKCTLKLSNL